VVFQSVVAKEALSRRFIPNTSELFKLFGEIESGLAI
jgi:hypothetical protein